MNTARHLADPTEEEEEWEEEDEEGQEEEEREEEEDSAVEGEEKKEEGGKRKRRTGVVQLTACLQEMVRLSRGLDDDIQAFFDEENDWRTVLVEEIRPFTKVLISAAETLPASPGRRMVTEDWEKAARARIIPVAASWMALRAILKTFTRGLRATGYPQYEAATSPWWAMITPGVLVVEALVATAAYKKFISLRSWLYRRNSNGRKKYKEYNNRKDVVARRKAGRPPKEVEAARKRKAYWDKKRRAHELSGLLDDV